MAEAARAPDASLGAATRALVELSAAVAQRDPERLINACARASAHAPAQAIEEALLQSYLFVGYPAALQALATWRAISGRRAPPPLSAADARAAWRERGEQTCRRVYGGAYDRLLANVRALHPDMATWMVEEGYGKVLARPGLDLKERELCIVALLAGQRSSEQLFSHLRGALHAGATVQETAAALEAALHALPEPIRAEAESVWDRVQARMASNGQG